MDPTTVLILAGVTLLLLVIALAGAFFTVEQQTAAIVQRFGKFVAIDARIEPKNSAD
ncbi:MAG: hypothetical protein SNJ82_13065 [Gemmataceae bacterium]